MPRRILTAMVFVSFATLAFAQNNQLQEVRLLEQRVDQLGTAGRLTEARQTLTAAFDRMKGVEHKDPVLHARLWFHRGALEKYLGNYPDSEASFRRALSMYEETIGQSRPEALIPILGGLAEALMHQQKILQAESSLRRALTLSERYLKPPDPQLAAVLNGFGSLYWTVGDLKKAEFYTREALAILETSLGPNNADVASVLADLGSILTAQRREAEALPLLKRSHEIFSAAYQPTYPDSIRALYLLGLAQTKTSLTDAEASLQKALALWREAHPQNHPIVPMILNAQARIRQSQGLVNEALALNEQALPIAAACLGKDHLIVGSILLHQSILLKAAKRKKEAAQVFKRVEEIRALHGVQSLDRHTVDIATLRKK